MYKLCIFAPCFSLRPLAINCYLAIILKRCKLCIFALASLRGLSHNLLSSIFTERKKACCPSHTWGKDKFCKLMSCVQLWVLASNFLCTILVFCLLDGLLKGKERRYGKWDFLVVILVLGHIYMLAMGNTVKQFFPFGKQIIRISLVLVGLIISVFGSASYSVLHVSWLDNQREPKGSMNQQPSLSQGDDVDDEAQTSSTEDMSDGSQDSLAIENVVPPARMPQVSPSYASSSNPSATKDIILPHVPVEIPASQLQIQNGMKIDGAISLEDEKKREHKRRSKNWTRQETLKLIKMRKELDDRFRKSGKKGALWEEIALALQREKFSRDGQQCKDKWEKLTASYKEVRDGAREKVDHPFYNELDDLLSWKSYKKEPDGSGDGGDAKRVKFEDGSGPGMSSWNPMGVPYALNHGINSMDMRELRLNHAVNNMEMKGVRLNHGIHFMDMNEAQKQETLSPGKRKREEVVSLLDTGVIQELLDTIITRQQRFLKELLDAADRKEQLKEQMRQEREEKWRAEDRAHRFAFNSAMIRLTQRLLGERPPPAMSMDIVPARMVATTSNGIASPKKRSKNWKKSEVSNLIRIRQEMESKFVMSTRRAGLWDELGEKLAALGIHRDGKQCREKWDKLMAEYKDVMDGRKDKDESTHFAQLTTILGRSKEGDAKSSSETTKDECTADG